MKLGDIAKQLACQLEGDPALDIHGVAAIEQAGPGELTFLSNPRYRQAVATTRAAAILIAVDGAVEREAGLPALAALRSANPYLDFARALELLHAAPKYAPGVHPTAVIAPTARLGANAHVGPYCFVDENVEIGRDAVLHSFVAIYRDARIGDGFFAHSHSVVREGCRIGDGVILQNGVVIGADGFGFARDAKGNYHKIPAVGITVLGDDVEVQANACVDRATLGETRIGRGVKIDDLVLVGHGSIVGEKTVLCGQVGLAGSTEVGKGCMLGGQVGCAGHLKIADGAMFTAQTGVPKDVTEAGIYSGYPAIENKQWLKNSAAINHLPDLLKTVRRLESETAQLKEELKALAER
jgi:UDP-3-O-[3-hydroxymyristoyl] glucosamine N-acyltransferase